MTTNPLKSISSLSPKTMGIILVGGVGAGLLLRKYRGGSAKSSVSATSPIDPSLLALQGSSTGNLGVGGTSDGGSTDSGTRDVGSISLPIVKWVVHIGGMDYMTDGTTLEPINTGA